MDLELFFTEHAISVEAPVYGWDSPASADSLFWPLFWAPSGNCDLKFEMTGSQKRCKVVNHHGA